MQKKAGQFLQAKISRDLQNSAPKTYFFKSNNSDNIYHSYIRQMQESNLYHTRALYKNKQTPKADNQLSSLGATKKAA